MSGTDLLEAAGQQEIHLWEYQLEKQVAATEQTSEGNAYLFS